MIKVILLLIVVLIIGGVVFYAYYGGFIYPHISIITAGGGKKYPIRTFPSTKYLVTEFPYKNNFSVLFSLIKVYPALNRFALENGFSEDSAVMEIYDIPNHKIIYRKAIVEK